MIGRITGRWRSELTHARDHWPLSIDRLRLHDGIRRQARYMSCTLFPPSPNDSATELPARWGWVYLPVKFAQAAIAAPLAAGWKRVLDVSGLLQDALVNFDSAF